MLSNQEFSRIYRQAYLPEHLPHYVEPLSTAKAHLFDDHLCYFRKNHLIFIGYPLGIDTCDSEQAYMAACEHFQPSTTAIIAPKMWPLTDSFENQPADQYYRLKLPFGDLNSDIAYMVRRAEKELRICNGTFGKEHRKLIKGFLSKRKLNPEQKDIFKRIHNYLQDCATARLLEARKKDALAAFTIVDLGSAEYAFYLFNFRSQKVPVPGASDLLLRELVKVAHAARKKAVNLGLGINDGIRRFKEKWGGVPFLPYVSAIVQRESVDLDRLAKKL